MKDQDHFMIEGVAEKGTWPTSSDIEVQFTKKITITIPIKSKITKDVDEATNRIVNYIRNGLLYEVNEVAHVATGKKHIKGRKEVNLTDSDEKKQGMCPSEEWKEKGQKIERIGHMCEEHKRKELEVLDKKRQELAKRVEEVGKRDEDSSLELQEILLKENSQM